MGYCDGLRYVGGLESGHVWGVSANNLMHKTTKSEDYNDFMRTSTAWKLVRSNIWRRQCKVVL